MPGRFFERSESWLDRHARQALWALVALFVVMGAGYSVVVPLFEAPDEVWHFAFVQYLALHRDLPVLSTDPDAIWLRESGQPPLYYVPAALITALLDTSDFPSFVRFNVAHPAVTEGSSSPTPNVFIHTELESFPYQGAVLAVHLVRLYSLLWGGGAIVAVYLYAHEAAPKRPSLALTAAAAAALNPSLIRICSVVNNDAALICLSTLAMWLCARLARGRARRGEALALGAVAGLAMLSKVSAAALAVPVALALLLAWRSDRRLSLLLGRGAAIGIVVLAVAGWWYGRNLALYGDLLGWSAWLEAGGPEQIGWIDVVRQLGRVGRLYWSPYEGLFAPWVWWGIGGAAWVAIVGWLSYLIGRARRHAARWGLCMEALLLGGAWLVTLFGGLVSFMRITPAAQGRLLFPAAGSMALFLVLGWRLALPVGWGKAVPALACAALLALCGWGLWAIPARFPPALGAPPEGSLIAMEGDFGEDLALRGVEVHLTEEGPDGEVEATLYWESRAGPLEDLRAIVRLVTVSGRTLAQRDREAALSTYPADLWQVGDIVRDPYVLPVGGVGPAMLRLVVEARDGERVIGQAASSPVVRLEGEPPDLEEVQHRVRYDLGGRVSLIGYSLRREAGPAGLVVTLIWEAQADMMEDWAVFVHLVDGAGERVGQGDGPPADGAYGTRYWQPGERVADVHVVDLDGGELPPDAALFVGLYRRRDGARLAAYTAGGARLPEDAIPLPMGDGSR